MSTFRYPGVQPFKITEENIFFGRTEDIEALYRKISVEDVVVLYSKSGLGKSSLLNAGVVPRIKAHRKFDPLVIRFTAYAPKSSENISPFEKTWTNVQYAFAKEETPTFIDDFFPAEKTLWYLSKQLQAQNDNQRKFFLIFDQFEELFTYPNYQIEAFKRQLSELIHTEIPQRFRKLVEEEVENPHQLDAEQLALVHTPPVIKVLFAIRSDQVSALNRLTDLLPVKRSWYELEALRVNQAEDAIINPAYKRGDFYSPIFDYSSEAIDTILDFLTKDRSQRIESFQLQILCQAIERKVIANRIKLVQPDDFGNIQDIYENYYEDQIRILKLEEEQQLAARRFIEEGLIFEEEQRRLSLYEGQIYSTYDIDETLLQQLVNTHLIRRESSVKGGFTYELSHDTLVIPVLKAKARRNEKEEAIRRKEEREKREQELKEIRARIAKEHQLREEAEKNWKLAEEAEDRAVNEARRAKRFTGIAVLVSVFAIAFAIVAYVAWTLASERQKQLTQSLEELQIQTQEKKELKIKQLILQADDFSKGKEYGFAIEALKEAKVLDSLDTEIERRIKFYEQKLGGQ